MISNLNEVKESAKRCSSGIKYVAITSVSI